MTIPIDLGSVVAAIGALGLASFALVDTTKLLYRGGVSRSGFGFIQNVVRKFNKGAKGGPNVLEILHANWINGTPLGDQKAIAKSLIKLRLTSDTAESFAKLTGVSPDSLATVVQKMEKNESLTPQEADTLGRFDLALTAMLDEAYSRADQRYRNMARLLASFVAIVLAALGGWAVNDPAAPHYLGTQQMWLAVLCGILATPLAPISKDLASALSAGVKVAESIKKK